MPIYIVREERYWNGLVRFGKMLIGWLGDRLLWRLEHLRWEKEKKAEINFWLVSSSHQVPPDKHASSEPWALHKQNADHFQQLVIGVWIFLSWQDLAKDIGEGFVASLDQGAI